MNTPIPDNCPFCGANLFERDGWGIYQCGTHIGDGQQTPRCLLRQRDQLAARVAVAEQERDQALALLGAYRMDKDAIAARVKELEDCIEHAWLLIANVSDGNWDKQHPEWVEVTKRWRDHDLHPILGRIAERRAKEAKP